MRVLLPPTSSLFSAAASLLPATLLLLAVSAPLFAIIEAVVRSPSVEQPFDLARWLRLLWTTVIVTGTAIILSMLIGTTLGLLLFRTNVAAHRLTLALLLLAACLPTYVVAIGLLALIAAYDLGNSPWVCGVLYGLTYTPLATLVLGSVFRSADPTFEDLARLDAHWPRVLRCVTLPQALWGHSVVALLVFWLVATDYTFTDLLIVRTFAEEVYTQFRLDYRRVAPVLTGVPVFLALTAALLAAQFRFRFVGEQTLETLANPPRMLPLGHTRYWLGLLLATAAIGPLIVICQALFARVATFDGLDESIVALLPDLRRSGVAALLGTGLTMLGSAGLAWALVRTRRLRWLVAFGVLILLATPAPVAGIGLIGLWNRPGWLGVVYDSPGIIVLGYLSRFLAVGTLLLMPAVRRVPRELDWAARLDGCSWVGTQRYVYWPTLCVPLALAGLVLLILCFGELGTTVLVAPPGWSTVSVRAFTLLHFGVYRDLALLTLLAIACIVLLWAPLGALLYRRDRSHARSTESTSRRT